MRRKDGYILRTIAGSNVLVPIGNEIANFNGVISLNDSAKFLWENLKEDITTEELTDNTIAGSNVLVPIGNEIANFNGVISLNDSAKFLWENLKEDITTEELTDNLIKEYEIDRELADKDVNEFIKILSENKMLV